MKLNQIFFLFQCTAHYIGHQTIIFTFNKISLDANFIKLYIMLYEFGNFWDTNCISIRRNCVISGRKSADVKTETHLIKYTYIRRLNLARNARVKNINHLTSLRELVVSSPRSALVNAGIKNLTMIKKIKFI
jgi:hypothetical protein